MKQLFTNNAYALLAAPISASSTSLTVMTGFGAKFPNPGPNEYFLVTLENEGATVREIIRVTSRVGDVFIFSPSDRGQEGTTPVAWASSPGNDTLVDHRVTAETMRRAMELPEAPIAPPGTSVYDQPFTLLPGPIIQLNSNYVPGSIRLFIGGLRQKLGVDFQETSPNQITLQFPFTTSDITDGQNVVIDFDVN